MNVPKMLNTVPAGERPIAFMEHKVAGALLTIVFFPGAGERGNGTTSTLPSVETNGTPKFIKNGSFTYLINVLTPQLFNDGSNPPTEWPLYYMRSMIDYANTLTPGKVFIMGLSLGGGAVWNALDDEQCCTKILGAVAICGTTTFDGSLFVKKYKIKVRGYHGQKDTTIGPGNTTTYISAIGNPLAEILVFPDEGHAIWDFVCNPAHPPLKLYKHAGCELIFPLSSVTGPEFDNVYEFFLEIAGATPVPPQPVKRIDSVRTYLDVANRIVTTIHYTDGTETTLS